MATPRIRLGRWGEDLAGRFLQDAGLQILETNYRCARGEVDIVAQDKDEVVFVEVRTRRGAEFGTPEESVTASKAQRLIATAQHYLQQKSGEGETSWRIDLVSVRLDRSGRLEDISHLRHAVEL